MSTIIKIHEILELLSENPKTGLSSKEISYFLKLPKSTCYRILSSLKECDYITQRGSNKLYFLGNAHLKYADIVLDGLDDVSICLPYLEELHQHTEQTTFYAKLSGSECIDMIVCGQINVEASIARGQALPLHATAAGKVFLSFLPEEIRENLMGRYELVAHSKFTITNKNTLKCELKHIYNEGVAFSFQELNEGINALATPVFNRYNKIHGALQVVGPSDLLTKRQLHEYVTHFLKASVEVTTMLKGTFPSRILEYHKII